MSGSCGTVSSPGYSLPRRPEVSVVRPATLPLKLPAAHFPQTWLGARGGDSARDSSLGMVTALGGAPCAAPEVRDGPGSSGCGTGAA